jgi:hypothetical protein
MRTSMISLGLLALVACGGAPPAVVTASGEPAATQAHEAPAVGKDGQACVGGIVTPPEGLAAAQDDALLAQAVDVTGKGKLCTGEVFQATAKVTVYRVWNSAKDYTLLGGWWSFAAPKGPVAGYRADNAICPEWSDLNVVSSCHLKVGAKVVVGPGQSAACDHDLTYPKSATNQVFIPNDSRSQKVYVEDCTPGAPWP